MLEPVGWRLGRRASAESFRLDDRAQWESVRPADVGFVGYEGGVSWRLSEKQGRRLQFEAAESPEGDFVLS